MNHQETVRFFFRRSAQHWVDSATDNNDKVYVLHNALLIMQMQ